MPSNYNNNDLRKGFNYFIKNVKKNSYSKGYVYNFSISKNMGNGKWANFSCAWFCQYVDPKLEDGDKIKIIDILAVNPTVYNDNVYYKYIVELQFAEKGNVESFANNDFGESLGDQIKDFENFDLNKTFEDSKGNFSSIDIMPDDIQF